MSSVSSRTRDGRVSRGTRDGEGTRVSRDGAEATADRTEADVRSSRSDGRRNRRQQRTPVDVMRQAMQQISQLTGRPPDTVSAIHRTDDGWCAEVDLIEMERVPATTNILATYEVLLDDDGNVTGYRRLRRYFRNAAEEG